MTEELIPEDDVQILPPDLSLQKKLGSVDLDKLLSPRVVATAQTIIERSSTEFLDESLREIRNLENSALVLRSLAGDARTVLAEVIRLSFSIKAKTGIGGYELVSKIAKSLQLFCEKLKGDKLAQQERDIIEWHIESLKRLMALKVKGAGGDVGTAILGELAALEKRYGLSG